MLIEITENKLGLGQGRERDKIEINSELLKLLKASKIISRIFFLASIRF